MRLNKREIEPLACPPGRKDVLFTDDEVRGFALRVTQAGAKVFLFQYRRGSKVHRLVLGRFGEITPTVARKKAEQARGDVAAGRHPVADQAEKLKAEKIAAAERRRQREVDAFTLGRLIDDWGRIGLKDRSAVYRHEAAVTLKRELARWWHQPAAAVEAAAVQRHVDALGARAPVMAQRVRAYGRAAYNWAMRRSLVSGNPFASVAIEARQVSRDRALDGHELGAMWNATGTLDYPFGPLLRLLLLTLQRRSEVAGMRWSELAADGSTWTIPATRAKNRKAHVVHLAPAARTIIADLPRREGSELVFTTTGRTPVSGFSRAVEQLRKLMADLLQKAGQNPDNTRAAASAWRLHDFRRTGVTMLAALKVPPHVADRILNHVQGSISGVAAIYQRHEFIAEREEALDLWARHVLAMGASTKAGKPKR